MKTLLLIVLDGWGYREENKYNAINAAKTPYWDELQQACPHTLLEGSGHAVGLPAEQMGNSEVGHLTIGAGRTIYQDLTRIDKAIEDKSFFNNAVLIKAAQLAQKNNKALHILGLLSPGGVHSHENHIHAMMQLAAQQQVEQIYLHAFLDGRDTPPQSAAHSIDLLEKKCQAIGRGRIVSLIGRYYAMDRDKRWDRVQKAYELLTEGKADYQAQSAQNALTQAYQRGESDEFVQATTIHSAGQSPVKINDGDVIVFMNFRADRARELSRAFLEPGFTAFKRNAVPQLAEFVSLTEYAKDIYTSIAFSPQSLNNVLGEYIAHQNLKQLRIAETEKYAHVTFFFNGGIEKPFAGEDRILIPSAKVATYDLQPEMSAYEVTETIIAALNSKQYALIICNFANPDMVGHTGNFNATVKAIETIDICLGKIIQALQATHSEMMITADHGNAEYMFDDKTQQPHTAHTNDLVPFVYYGRKAKITHPHGTLADIAPTILYVMNIAQPVEMTGQPLIELV